MNTTLLNAIAQALTWMLTNTVIDGDYQTRPERALGIWEKENNVSLPEAMFNEVINTIEW